MHSATHRAQDPESTKNLLNIYYVEFKRRSSPWLQRQGIFVRKNEDGSGDLHHVREPEGLEGKDEGNEKLRYVCKENFNPETLTELERICKQDYIEPNPDNEYKIQCTFIGTVPQQRYWYFKFTCKEKVAIPSKKLYDGSYWCPKNWVALALFILDREEVIEGVLHEDWPRAKILWEYISQGNIRKPAREWQKTARTDSRLKKLL